MIAGPEVAGGPPSGTEVGIEFVEAFQMAYDLDPGSVQAVRGRLATKPQAGQASESPVQQPADSVVQAVTAAVEKYLSARRRVAPAGTASPVPPSRPALREIVAGAVDQYLEQRAPRPIAPACGCGIKPPGAGSSISSTSASSAGPGPPAPPVSIVDFVCESDVREAMVRGAKIFIGPRTIVTPSARELAAADEILVRAQR